MIKCSIFGWKSSMYLLETIESRASFMIEELERRIMLAVIPAFDDVPFTRDGGNGRVLVSAWTQGGAAIVLRVMSDGSLDHAFGGGDGMVFLDGAGWIDDLRVQGDGKILVLTAPPGHRAAVLYRLNPDGQPDQTFGTHGSVILYGETPILGQVDVEKNGRILVAEVERDLITEGSNVGIWRFTETGQLDSSFSEAGRAVIHSPVKLWYVASLTDQRSGKIDLVLTPDSLVRGGAFVRLLPNGSLDRSFAQGGITAVIVRYRIDIESDPLSNEKLLTVEQNDDLIDQPAMVLRQYDLDGRLDPTFGDQGVRIFPGIYTALVYSPPLGIGPRRTALGLLISEGSDDSLNVLMINRDGSPDTNFADGGWFLVQKNSLEMMGMGMDVSPGEDGGLLVTHLRGGYFEGRPSELVITSLDREGQRRATFGADGQIVLDIDRSIVPPIDLVQESLDASSSNPRHQDGRADDAGGTLDQTVFSVQVSPFSTQSLRDDDGEALLDISPRSALLGQTEDDLFAE